VFVKCSGVASPPPSHLSSTSPSENESSGQLHATRSSSSVCSAGIRMSASVVQQLHQSPAIPPLVPYGQLQRPAVLRPAVLNPVFVGGRLASVPPAAMSPPSAVLAVPLVSRAVSPQHYTDLNAVPHTVNLSPVIQPRNVADSSLQGVASDRQSSPAVDNG